MENVKNIEVKQEIKEQDATLQAQNNANVNEKEKNASNTAETSEQINWRKFREQRKIGL